MNITALSALLRLLHRRLPVPAYHAAQLPRQAADPAPTHNLVDNKTAHERIVILERLILEHFDTSLAEELGLTDRQTPKDLGDPHAKFSFTALDEVNRQSAQGGGRRWESDDTYGSPGASVTIHLAADGPASNEMDQSSATPFLPSEQDRAQAIQLLNTLRMSPTDRHVIEDEMSGGVPSVAIPLLRMLASVLFALLVFATMLGLLLD